MTSTLYRAASEPTPRDLELLLDLSRRFAAGDAIESVLEAVATDFRLMLPFDRVEYSTLSTDGNSLIVRWVEAFGGPEAIGVGDVCTYTGEVPDPEERRPYLILDLVEYAESKPDEHAVCRLAETGYLASISCPLVLEGEVTGVIFFNTRKPNAWNRRHLALVELIAGHLAVAAARSKLTASLEASNEALRRAHAARTEFIAAVSHEIRTPLTGIVGLTAALHSQIDDLSTDEVREFAGVVNQQATELAELVEDLLVATRAEAGGLRVSPHSIEIGSVVRETLESMGDVVHPDVEGEPTLANADPLRLRQILRNLLTNAVRHGGPTVSVSFGSDATAAFIRVSDDGDGVAPEYVDVMFDAFDLSNRAHAESVGLGLSVSRSLALAMGGDLTYERRDELTVMSVALPPA